MKRPPPPACPRATRQAARAESRRCGGDPFASDASFGIDGPDGSPLYGEAAENEWKSRYISDSSSDEFDFLSSSESDGEGRRRRKKKKEKHRRRRPKREEPSTDSDW